MLAAIVLRATEACKILVDGLSFGPHMDARPRPVRTVSPGWIGPLLATMLIQTNLALLNRVIPTLAPALMPAAALNASAVGFFDALSTAGAMAFLMGGNPLIRRCGAIRALQIGLLLGCLGIALLAASSAAALACASLLMGLAYGPSSPAGSDILLRYAPPAHQTLIFSIKQAAVPAGGILAGLLLPRLVESRGWYATVAILLVATVLTTAAVTPVRAAIDADRDHAQSLHLLEFLSRRNLAEPLGILWRAPMLLQHAGASACFSCAQGAVFAYYVTYLVHSCDFSLAAAGAIFAIFQASGMVGRILLGWLCDRLGSGVPILRATGFLSAATIAALALSSPHWPFIVYALTASVGGITISSWNGVNLAEVARAAPNRRVSETTAGVALVNYFGFVAGPLGVAGLVSVTGSYSVALLVMGCIAAVGSVLMLSPRALRRAAPQRRPSKRPV
jgi:MFS family permease